MTKWLANKGYDAKNIFSLDEKYKCLICGFILRDPVQITCGHRICYACLHVENNIVRCPECSEITLTSKIRLDKGFDNEIQTLIIVCILCEWSGHLKNYQNHLEQLHNQYRCLYCNEIFTSLTLMNQHKETKCPQMMVNCNLQSYGCNELVLRCNLSEHYLGEMHQKTLVLYALQLVSKLTEENQKIACSDMHDERKIIDLPSKVTTALSTTLVTDEYNAQQEYINEMVNTLSDGIVTLNDDLQRLSSESLQQSQLIEMTSQSLTQLKTSCEESNVGLNAFNTNMSILQQDYFSLKHKIEETQSISYDGILIWKITNIQEKMIDAQSERQVSIYSPPFYSSLTGYKMCARLYLYGDGNARRTHISLFFVLMRGLHDSLLKFPFTHKVTFCLFDQTGEQQHIIDSFRPDPKSSSFQKPRCDMNIASGIPKFVSLDKIQQQNNRYIKENTMFIKVMVDFENLPKTMIPFAVGLNPGLPTYCQQRMIQQEIERRVQLQSQKKLTSNAVTTNSNLSISNQ
ncbi:unnamed protein product [Rotaria sordida]|uniref:Uncharacterized protein n=2 Tax=Rotaria sordida TaxID=392033 RepID=A0A813S7Q0_9BILA|nr:unnamed protein product [Rotaria sordida]